jgi:ABC-type transporter MlaC component
LDSELIDDCYIESIDYLEKSMTSEINNFKNEILELKNEELQNINLEYKKKYEIIENKHTDLRSKNNSDTSLQKLIDEHESIKLEEKFIRKSLDHKYLISVDFALIGSIVFV